MEGMTEPKPVQLPPMRPAVAHTREPLADHVIKTWQAIPKTLTQPHIHVGKRCLTYCGPACDCELRGSHDRG